MGDSTTMTIEFLRARLLSERSVSKAARQRADQLAIRVMELEEQLRLVTVQRKKAEKAAVEVLAILETQGISDLSDIDSSSEGVEIPCDDNPQECESSTTSKMERSEVEIELSGSEPEVSNSQGKSLSWKSHSKSPDSSEKGKGKQLRQRQRRRYFMLSMQSSSKHKLGKSCRKIKPRDIRSEADCETYERGVECSNYYNDRLEDYRDDHNGLTEADIFANRSERDEVMERVLEQQAELIGQFQAEENAQREWEDKYNENNMIADHKPGNTTSGKSKEFTELAIMAQDFDEEAKLNAVQIVSTKMPMDESSTSENNKSNVATDTNNSKSRDLISTLNALENDAGTQSDGTPTKETKAICGMIRNEKQNEIMRHNIYPTKLQSHPKMAPQQKCQIQTSNSNLGDVLKALQCAKLSLSQELSKLPSSTQNTVAITAPTSQTMSAAAPNVNVPIGSASLFRLPTDSFPSVNLSRPKFCDIGLRLPTNHNIGYACPITTSCVEGRSRDISGKEYNSDNYVCSSSRFMDSNRYSRAYSDMSAEGYSFHTELSNTYSDIRNGIPPGNRHSLYGGDHARSDVRML